MASDVHHDSESTPRPFLYTALRLVIEVQIRWALMRFIFAVCLDAAAMTIRLRYRARVRLDDRVHGPGKRN
jgi:hypothetical protein